MTRTDPAAGHQPGRASGAEPAAAAVPASGTATSGASTSGASTSGTPTCGTSAPGPTGGMMRRGLDRPSPVAWLVLGLIGSVLAAAGSYWTAAIPLYFRTAPPAVVDLMTPQAPPGRALWYVGIVVLAFAWLGFGHRLWSGAGVPWRVVRAAGLWWTLPWLFAVPASSRDLWAYAAQAKIAAAGLDPYRVGPDVLGGVFAANVTPRWVATPSPYGPLWTLIGRGLAPVFGDHQLAAVLLLRLPTAIGLILLAFTVPALAHRLGGSPAVASWLMVANPLVVVHGVAGGHNDVLMVGFIAAGVLLAVSRRGRWALLLAGALVAAGAAVKLPAIVAVPFLPLLAARFAGGGPPVAVSGWADLVRRRGRDVLIDLVAAVVGAGVVLAVLSLAAGQGLQWVGAANTDSHGGGPATTAILLLVLIACWLTALRRGNELLLLALALLAVSLVSQYSLAWYWFWPLVVAAPVLRGRPITFLAAAISVYEVFYVRPNGQNLMVRPELVLAVAIVGCWLVLDRRWRPFRLTRSQPATDVEAARADSTA